MTPFHARTCGLLVVACAMTAAGAQDQPNTPPRRAHHALSYDEVRQAVILTAGSTPTNGGNSFVFFNDLWSFDGTRWTQLQSSGDKMSGVALASGGNPRKVWSFGGYVGNPTGSIGALRALDADSWTSRGDHPSIRAAEPGFVYDSRRDRFIAFGGSGGRSQTHGDTWVYREGQWTKLDVAGPPARQAHVMVYDSARGRVVVFGGSGPPAPGQQGPTRHADTWEFDGERWHNVTPATGPVSVVSAGATYDSHRGLVIVFGGLGADGFRGDTWAWNGREWSRLSTSGPEPRAMGYIAYDKKRRKVVLFGGRKGYPDGDLNDTWEWDGTRWTRVP